ncbi:ATP-binding protein [Haloarcula litorea]|uniref:ATP-binding protein n=1 Tax=Haloarcula litorea TaxID=3032579 RepID=UPI0023E75D5A|nr:ATP-binding protein [Halomicroarcula sp. GDY20]
MSKGASKEAHYTKQFKEAVEEAEQADSSEERVKKLLKAKKYIQKVSQEMENGDSAKVEKMSDSLDDVAHKEMKQGRANGRNNGGGGGRSSKQQKLGQSKKSESQFFEEPPSKDLDDVGGMDDLKQVLKKKVIHQFQETKYRDDLGVSPTNGIMLYGPPGTGKTYLSEALAGELGYRYAQIRGSDLISRFVGQSGQNVADLFKEARQVQPCVIFIDEIDSVASNRQSLEHDSQAYQNAVSEMLQGIHDVQDEDILVMASTNLLNSVDGAIRRSGRFDEKIEVPPPDEEARKEILEVHLRGRETGSGIDLDQLAESTEEFSAADLKKVVEEAAQTAHIESIEQDQLQPVTHQHLRKAVEDTEPSLQHWNDGKSR